MDILWVKGYLQFSAGEARMGPNKLYNPNQWFVRYAKSKRRCTSFTNENNYKTKLCTCSVIFLTCLKYKGINLYIFKSKYINMVYNMENIIAPMVCMHASAAGC